MKRLRMTCASLSFLLFGSASAEMISANGPVVNHHELGAPIENLGWAAPSNLGSGFLTYGPYTANYQDGEFKATFKLSVDNNSADDLVVAFVDVYDDASHKEIARREIHRKEFVAARAFQLFDLSFVTSGPNNLEFRVYVFGKSYVAHESTIIIQLASLRIGIPTPANALGGQHEVGVKGSGSSWLSEPEQGTGFLTIMPIPPLRPGNYVAEFAVQIGRGSLGPHAISARGMAATFEVYNRKKKELLSQKAIPNENLPNGIQMQKLPFTYDGVGDLVWRVYVHGKSLVVHYSSSVSAAVPVSYKGSDPALKHQLGSQIGTAWAATRAKVRGYLTYGAYRTDVPPGISTATFELAASGIHTANEDIAQLDIFDDDAGKTIAKRIVKGRDFTISTAPHDFDIVFEILKQTTLEFRVYTTGAALLRHNSTVITPDRLPLAALWNQSAHFEFRKRDYFVHQGVHDNDTASLVALDGVWYAFNREEAPISSQYQAADCKKANRSPLQVVVRASSDRGTTWTDPVIVARPNGVESSAEGCEIVDGGAFFDSETDSWHYLGQCIGVTGGWSMCHYTRHGTSPMGLFDADESNPVVRGGALWSQICSGSGKACSNDMTDEGTPQIIGKSADGFYYVTFHGASYGSLITGARGIARTADFRQWQVSGDDLPGDAILSIRDCSGWRIDWADSGCIGEGTSRILRSGGQFYQLAEAADRSLICQQDQKWLFGLFRNTQIGAAGTWESYAENPFIVNKNVSPVGCALQYMNLFRDRGEIFLEFSLYTPDYAYPNYTYQLVDGRGDSKVLQTK